MATQPGSAGNVIAALCSLFIPGLGQLIQGRLLSALLPRARARRKRCDRDRNHDAHVSHQAFPTIRFPLDHAGFKPAVATNIAGKRPALDAINGSHACGFSPAVPSLDRV